MNSTEVLSCYLGGNDGGDDGRRRGDENGMDDDSGKDSGSGNDGGGGEGGDKEGSSHTQLSTSTHRQKSVDAYTSPHKILYSTDKSSMKKKEDIRPRKEKGKGHDQHDAPILGVRTHVIRSRRRDASKYVANSTTTSGTVLH